MSRQLAEVLLKERLIPDEKFQEAQRAEKAGVGPVQFLIEKGYISESKLLYFLSQKFGIPGLNISKFAVMPEAIRLIPYSLVKKTSAVPIKVSKSSLVVAVADPTNLARLDALKLKTNLNIEVVLTTFSSLEEVVSKHYGSSFVETAVESYQKEQRGSGDSSGLELVEVHSIEGSAEVEAPVINFVNGILSESIKKGASDIHVEPYEDRFRVRMRIDGILHEVASIPVEMKRAVVARLKIMARMDIAESRIPQDGRIKLRLGTRMVDYRVNTLPTLFGEKVVLRLLDKSNLLQDLTQLGMEQKQMEIFKKAVYAPNGMVLVTGPTGSGKTTTLYSALNDLNKVTDNISTVEDPVEYNFTGINQTQVHKEIGLTFASVLRSLLRQDPDIILLGEIRDYETAEVAIQAALTGHLVLSTLHTNDAASAITRLMNMGVEPFLVTAALNSVVAQRLVRKICTSCRRESPVPKERLQSIGFLPDEVSKVKTYSGVGCSSCANTGYKGRISIFEVMELSNVIKELVLKGSTAFQIKQQAVKEGMQTLRRSALLKVASGVTSIEEALTATMEA